MINGTSALQLDTDIFPAYKPKFDAIWTTDQHYEIVQKLINYGCEYIKDREEYTLERQNALRLAMHNNERTEPGRDAEALIREVRTDINDNRAQNRAVVNTENKSVAREKQSVSIAEQRRLEEQRRALEQERAREARKKKSRSYDIEL